MKQQKLWIGLLALSFVGCSQMQKEETAGVAETKVMAPGAKGQAVLKAGVNTKIKGQIYLEENNGKVTIQARVEGLKPGPHGFHIHDKGDCSSADFNSAGPHFNPENHPHGALETPMRHAGDLGNIVADKQGKANHTVIVDGITLSEGAKSILGKAVVIHHDADDLKTQPTGNSGKRIACGVIESVQ